MTRIRTLSCNDLFRFASLQLDHLTPTGTASFYLDHMIRYPDYCKVAIAPGPKNRIMGYFIGEIEVSEKKCRSHVLAVAVAPEYRRKKLATNFIQTFEVNTDPTYIRFFRNVYVGVTNTPAIKMFEKLGYTIRTCVRDFYSQEKDAFEMRKYICTAAPDANNTIFEQYVIGHVNTNYMQYPKYIWGRKPKPERAGFDRAGIKDDYDIIRVGGQLLAL